LVIKGIEYQKMENNLKIKEICPVDFAFRRIGGKYKGRILWYLNNHHVLRYGELKKYISDITTKMLTQTLKELENDQLINRKVYPVVPPKVEYKLTRTGKELIPFIGYLNEWAKTQMDKENLLQKEC